MLIRNKHRMLAHLLTCATFYLLIGCSSNVTSFYDNFKNQKNSNHQSTFKKVSIHMEHNASDNDTEIVISAKGNDTGLKNLWLRNPEDTELLHISADNQNLGLREIDLETPEPDDATLIKQQYPEGQYTFIGQTVDNKWLFSTTTLSHSLPSKIALSIATTSSSEQALGDEIIMTWPKQTNVAAYYIEVENKSKSNRIHIALPPSASTFAIPRHWFAGDTSYSFSIQAKNHDGNVTTTEVSKNIGKM